MVEKIQIELNLERRLEALGLTEGSQITVLNNDKKGAMTVKFRGTRFALGRTHCDNIFVKEQRHERKGHKCRLYRESELRQDYNCSTPNTGANLKVANWPGVTVEKKEGYTTYKGQEFKLIDLPGIYRPDFLYNGRKSVPRMHHER